MNKMYYNRTISETFENLLSDTGEFGWLIPYIKEHKDLDLLLVNNKGDKDKCPQECHIYRGTSRIARIVLNSKGTWHVDANDSYKELADNIGLSGMFGKSDSPDFKFNEDSLEELRKTVAEDPKYDRYYKNKKEGWWQNNIQRRYGIDAKEQSPMLVFDKETVIGYESEKVKGEIFGKLQDEYKKIRKKLQSEHPDLFGQSKDTALGNELDLVALDKDGNIHLMELKYCKNTRGIYMSPFQIGLYYELFDNLDKDELAKAVKQMIEQRQRLGLLPKGWAIPKFSGKIIPELIICGGNPTEAAQERYKQAKKSLVERDVRIVVKDDNMKKLTDFND